MDSPDTASIDDQPSEPHEAVPSPMPTSDTEEQPVTFELTEKVAGAANAVDPVSESISALRVHLDAQHLRNRRRSLAVCGPAPRAGASFMAANLAVSMARAGVKTLLIDSDLRSPSVHRYIRPSREVVGLKQALESDLVPFSEIIHPVMPSLSVIYSGGSAGDAAELLASDRLKELFGLCVRDYDLTIIDTAPANKYADGRLIASLIRYAMIVVRRDHSFVADLKTVVNEMKADGVNVVGTFLNDY